MEQSKSIEELQAENEHLRQQLQEMEQAQRKLQEHADTLLERAASLEAIFERAAIGLVVGSMEGRVVKSNPHFQAIVGYTDEELHGMSFAVFTHSEEVAHEMALLTEVIEGKRPSYQIDKRYIRKDGQIIWVRVGVSLLRDAEGNPALFLASVEDINEQKRMQETLTEHEERMRLVLEATNDGVWDWHIPTGELYFSDGWQTMLGFEPGELEGHVSTWENLLHPDDKTQTIQTVNDYLHGESSFYEVKFRMQTKSGGWKWILGRGKVVQRDIEGKPVRMIGSHVDITEQKKAEQTLQHSHDMLDVVMNSIDALIYVADMDTYEMVYMNKHGVDAFGSINGRACWQILQKGQHGPCLFCTNNRLLDAQGNPTAPYRWEFQNTLNGRWYGIVDQAIRWVDGRIVRIEVATDIDAMKKDAETLRIFKAMADYSPDAIGIANPEGVITYANPAFQDMFGYGDDTLGMINVTLFTQETQQQIVPTLLEYVLTKGFWMGMLTGLRKDGSAFPAQLSGFCIRDEHNNVLAMPAIIRDMTEMQQKEQALRASEDERKAYQEQIIEAQQAALRELSAPLLPISDSVVVMPLIGSIDTRRAQQVMETLLEGVSQNRADVAIVDITGVQVVDTQVANALIQAAQAVKLLGAQVVLTGIGPTMAQTLVSLGADLSSIVTRGSLRRGIAWAMQGLEDR